MRFTERYTLTHPTRAERLALLCILTVALIVRLRYLGEIEHNVDHAFPVWQAMRTLGEGWLPLAGQGTSVLFANPPLTGYLLVPVVALTRSPLGVYVFIIALNWLGVWFVYRAGRSLLGVRVGLAAAALFAVNPWIIEYSRTSWVQSLLPFFVPAVAWLLWPVLLGEARRPVRRTALALVMAALLAHTYLLAFLIIAPLTVLIVVYRRDVPTRGIAIGGAVFVALGTLYGIGLLDQFDNVRARVDLFFNENSESGFKLEAWDGAVRLVTGAEYELGRGQDAPINDWARRHDVSQIAHIALTAAVLAGIGAAVVGVSVGGRARRVGVILLVWWGIPILGMSYTGSPVHTFYQLMGLPAGHVLAAWGLCAVGQAQTRTGARLLAVGLAAFGGLMLVNSARYYQETEVTPGQHRMLAMPVDEGMRLGDVIDAHLLPGGIVYAEVEDWILNSFTGRLFSGVWDTRAPAVTLIPARGGLYITATAGEDGPPPMPYAGTAVDARTYADGVTIQTSVLPPAGEIDTSGMETLNIASQQGLVLVAAELMPVDAAAGDWKLVTVWRVDSIGEFVPRRFFSPYIHIFDTASGERIGVVDGAVVPGPMWRVGDVHVHRMAFTVDPDVDFRLEVGQFDGLTAANVIFVLADGAQVVNIPLNAP